MVLLSAHTSFKLANSEGLHICMPYKNLYLMLKECHLCLMTLNSFREIFFIFSFCWHKLYSFSCFGFPTVVGKFNRDIWELVVQDDLVSILFLTQYLCVSAGFLSFRASDIPSIKSHQLAEDKFSSEWNPNTSRFDCKECGLSYRQYKNLVAHKKIHLGETRCYLCNKVLSRKSHVVRHLLNIHGIHVSSQAWQ